MSDKTETAPLDLAALRRLCEEATPGPWDHFRLEDPSPVALAAYVTATAAMGSGEFYIVGCDKPDGRADVCHAGNGPTSAQNAAFIAAARTALPALLDRVERAERASEEHDADLEGERDRLRASLTAAESALAASRAEAERLRGSLRSAESAMTYSRAFPANLHSVLDTVRRALAEKGDGT